MFHVFFFLHLLKPTLPRHTALGTTLSNAAWPAPPCEPVPITLYHFSHPVTGVFSGAALKLAETRDCEAKKGQSCRGRAPVTQGGRGLLQDVGPISAICSGIESSELCTEPRNSSFLLGFAVSLLSHSRPISQFNLAVQHLRSWHQHMSSQQNCTAPGSLCLILPVSWGRGIGQAPAQTENWDTGDRLGPSSNTDSKRGP